MLEKYHPDDMDYAKMNPIIFGDYWAAAMEDEPTYYEDIQDFDVCKALVEEVHIMFIIIIMKHVEA